MVMLLSELHPEKVEFPIEVTLSGMEMFSSELQK